MVIDAHLAKFIHNNGDAPPVVGGQYAVQQRRLAGPKKPVRRLPELVDHSHSP